MPIPESTPEFAFDGQKPAAGWHSIEDDLADTWLEDWAAAGVTGLELTLKKRANYYNYLDGLDVTRPDQRHEDPIVPDNRQLEDIEDFSYPQAA